MSEEMKPRESVDMIEQENARVGYQVAVDFWIYQGQLNWNRFNVMLLANSVVIAVIAAVLSSQRHLPVLTSLLAIAGLFLCRSWRYLMARGFDYHRFWALCAQELEKRYLKDAVEIVLKVESFGKEGEAYFKVLDKPHRFGSRWSEVSQRRVAYSVIRVFKLVYVGSIIIDILILMFTHIL